MDILQENLDTMRREFETTRVDRNIDNFLADERDEMDEDSEEWDVSSEEENKVDDEWATVNTQHIRHGKYPS